MSWSVPWRTSLTDASLPSKPRASAPSAQGPRASGLSVDNGASLPELVRRSKQGDRDAFAKVYEQCAPAVHGLLRASLPREHCEDLHQEVFVTAWTQLDRFDARQSFPPWVYGIARNLLRQRFRELARRRSSSVAIDELPAPAEAGAGGPLGGARSSGRARAE